MFGQNSRDVGRVDVLGFLNKRFVIRGCPLCVKLAAVFRGQYVVSVSERDLVLGFFGHAIIVTAVVSREPGGGRNEGAVNGC